MWQGMLRNWLLGAATRAKPPPVPPIRHLEQPPEQGPPERQRDVCHVGLISLGIEAGGLVDRLQGVIKTEGAGFRAREGGLGGAGGRVQSGHRVPHGGTRTAQAVVFGHHPRWIISAGFAGGLDQRMAQGDILLADDIVDRNDRRFAIDFAMDADALATQPHLHVGRLLTSDQIIGDPRKRNWGSGLRRNRGRYGIDAVADVCRREKVRFLAVRGLISDAIDQAYPRHRFSGQAAKPRPAAWGPRHGAIAATVEPQGHVAAQGRALVASDRLAGFLVRHHRAIAVAFVTRHD